MPFHRSLEALVPAGALVLAMGLLGVACGIPRPPLHLAPPAPAGRTPLVFVPGVTGTVLRDGRSGAIVWGSGRRFLLPRDGGYRLAPPLDGSRDGIEPWRVLLEVHLGPFLRRPVYQPLVDALTAAGYTFGDLQRPRPGDDFFLFGYDWRRDNVEAAARLAAGLARVRSARGAGRLGIDLVCQSNGAHVCRYLAKHGSADLEVAEAGGTSPPPGVAIRRLVLVGASNGGALRILREMNRGRRYLPVAGRRFLPEVFFGMEALYQDLPADAQDLFVDADGAPHAVDLYDPSAWERYGWSLYGDDAARRVERRPDRFGTAAERRVFLAAALERARRLQRVLARDAPGFGPTALHLLENADAPTPARAVLVEDDGGRETFFAGDDFVERRPGLLALTTAVGDGHASLASQRRLSPQELGALAESPRRVHGPHFETILEPATLSHIVAIATAAGGAPDVEPGR